MKTAAEPGKMHAAPTSCWYSWPTTTAVMIALRQNVGDSRTENSWDVLFVADVECSLLFANGYFPEKFACWRSAALSCVRRFLFVQGNRSPNGQELAK